MHLFASPSSRTRWRCRNAVDPQHEHARRQGAVPPRARYRSGHFAPRQALFSPVLSALAVDRSGYYMATAGLDGYVRVCFSQARFTQRR